LPGYDSEMLNKELQTMKLYEDLHFPGRLGVNEAEKGRN